MKRLRWFLLLGLLAGPALAQNTAAPPPYQPSPQERQQMAQLHERMAACLRSNRPFDDCRNELWHGCQQPNMGRACPMMGPGWHHRMMGPPPPPPAQNP